MTCGAACPIERPCQRTSMRVRSNWSNTSSTLRPIRTASTSYLFPCSPTVPVFVTVRHSDQRKASRSCAVDGIRGEIDRPPLDRRLPGLGMLAAVVDRLDPRAEHVVHRVGRDGLPPPRAFRDRAGADRAVVGHLPTDAVDRAAAGGLPLVGMANRHEDGHRRAAREQVRSRRRPDRPQGRARVRPVRPHPHRGPLARPLDGAGGAARHRPARPRQGQTRRHDATGAGADRDRLPAPGRTPAHHRTGRTRAVRPTPRRSRPRRPRPRPTPAARHRRDARGVGVIEKLKSTYGFTKTPFGRGLAPQMLHRHGTHAEAAARIDWCISERGLGVVTGEVGAGKTVAVRAALAGLDSSRNTVIYLVNPTVGGRGLYSCIVTALGGIPRFHKAALIPQTMDLLAAEEHERGRHTTVVLDEAHLLGADQLEELRLLTNSEMDSHSPFACLLVGQPTLRRRIKLGTFAALDQRITLRYAMNGMTDKETASYITHHLKLAGRSDTLFSDAAISLIHQVSRGLPRAVNNIAVQALVAAYAGKKNIVDESSARAAVTEVTAE